MNRRALFGLGVGCIGAACSSTSHSASEQIGTRWNSVTGTWVMVPEGVQALWIERIRSADLMALKATRGPMGTAGNIVHDPRPALEG